MQVCMTLLQPFKLQRLTAPRAQVFLTASKPHALRCSCPDNPIPPQLRMPVQGSRLRAALRHVPGLRSLIIDWETLTPMTLPAFDWPPSLTSLELRCCPGPNTCVDLRTLGNCPGLVRLDVSLVQTDAGAAGRIWKGLASLPPLELLKMSHLPACTREEQDRLAKLQAATCRLHFREAPRLTALPSCNSLRLDFSSLQMPLLDIPWAVLAAQPGMVLVLPPRSGTLRVLGFPGSMPTFSRDGKWALVLLSAPEKLDAPGLPDSQVLPGMGWPGRQAAFWRNEHVTDDEIEALSLAS